MTNNLPQKYQKLLGKVKFLKTEVRDEEGTLLPAGTLIRIVAITPKVIMRRREKVALNPQKYDNLPYFYNAVRADQKEDSGKRIRENFATLGVK